MRYEQLSVLTNVHYTPNLICFAYSPPGGLMRYEQLSVITNVHYTPNLICFAYSPPGGLMRYEQLSVLTNVHYTRVRLFRGWYEQLCFN